LVENKELLESKIRESEIALEQQKKSSHGVQIFDNNSLMRTVPTDKKKLP